MTAPSPGQLWHQANGDAERYRVLMRQHGYLLAPGDPGYDLAPKTLPCGYPGPQKPAGEWCDKFDMPSSGCAHCRGISEEPEPERGEPGPVFTARYGGKCSACGDPVGAGEQIRADGTGHGYLCVECGS